MSQVEDLRVDLFFIIKDIFMGYLYGDQPPLFFLN